MDPEASAADPDSESFIEEVLKYLLDTVSREDLQILLLDDEAWEGLVDICGLSREEADELREILMGCGADPALEDKDEPAKCMLDRERFLDEFPNTKKALGELIKDLHRQADRLDEVHRNCTISNVVANSTSVASGVLSILGLALAPMTAGVSLALSATGVGLGAAAAVTSMSTSIVEHSAEAGASSLVSTSTDKAKEIAKTVGQSVPKAFSMAKTCINAVDDIGKYISAIKVAKANPRLVASARRLMTTGKISVRSSRQVQKAFGGTALAMTKGVRIMGAATTGFFLALDVVSLVKESKHLHEGAKAESAKELRQKAQELEQMLQELIQTHESLQGGPQ